MTGNSEDLTQAADASLLDQNSLIAVNATNWTSCLINTT